MQLKSGRLVSLLLLATAIALEIVACATWFGASRGTAAASSSGATGFIFAHDLSVVLAWLGWRQSAEEAATETHRRNARAFGLALWAFVPPLGAIAALVIIRRLRDRNTARPATVLELIESMDAEENFFRDLALEIKTTAPTPAAEATAVRPWMDILRYGTVEERKSAISALRRQGDADAVSLLISAREDPEYDVQHLASLAIASIERDWTRRIQTLLAEIESLPGDASLRNEVAQAYLLVYRSDLLSPRLKGLYLRRALEHAVVSMQIDARQPTVLALIGKIRLFSGHVEQSIQAFDRATALDPARPSFRLWRAEAHFKLRDFVRLRDECEQVLATATPVAPKMGASLRFWTTHE